MGIIGSASRLSHGRYRRFDKINRYYLGRRSTQSFEREIAKRLGNDPLPVNLGRYFLAGHNPISHPAAVMKWIVERYKPAFKYLDRQPPLKSILEVGCGFGVSTWLLSDIAENVVGLDYSQDAIRVASRLFPEAKYICSETSAYLDANPDVFFDVLISCYGHFEKEWCEKYRKNFGIYLQIGCRPFRAKLSRKEYLAFKHKLPGLQLGFNCTLYGGPRNGIALSYPSHYFTWSYLHEFHHYLRHRDVMYPPI